jgi:hypothetical protein
MPACDAGACSCCDEARRSKRADEDIHGEREASERGREIWELMGGWGWMTNRRRRAGGWRE